MPLFLKYNFADYRNLSWEFSSFSTLKVFSTVNWSPWFWWDICNQSFYNFPFIYKTLFSSICLQVLFFLSLVFRRLIMVGLGWFPSISSCLVFEIFEFVNLYIFPNFLSIVFLVLSLLPRLLVFWCNNSGDFLFFFPVSLKIFLWNKINHT